MSRDSPRESRQPGRDGPPSTIIIVDTGIIYDLVASPTLATATTADWADSSVLVPPSTPDELRYRDRVPISSLPPELPRKGLGLITSKKSQFEVVSDMTDAERADVELLQGALGGERLRNAAECEAVVLAAFRHPQALILLDDAAALDELCAYFERKTGLRLRYQHNVHLIEALGRRGRLSREESERTLAELRQKRRPFV